MSADNLKYLIDLNNQDILGRNFAINSPLLTDPYSFQEIRFLKMPLEISDYKSLDNISQEDKEAIYTQISGFFKLSHDSQVAYQDSILQPKILDEENSTNPLLYGQFGLFSKVDIQKYQPLGIYSGIYIRSYTELEFIMTQFPTLLVVRYGNACTKDGLPVICGHYNGNYMTIINDWRPLEWYNYSETELTELKAQSYNTSSIIIQSGDYFFIAYLAARDIPTNEQLLTDYGQNYWQREKDLIDGKETI